LGIITISPVKGSVVKAGEREVRLMERENSRLDPEIFLFPIISLLSRLL
jgi:hypothetical protein